jgi:hypothetical protein
MAALTTNTTVKFKDTGGSRTRYLKVAAAQHIKQGGIVGVNAAGNAIIPDNTAATVAIVGIAMKEYDNTLGAITVDRVLEIRTSFQVKCKIDVATYAGAAVFARNDNTQDIFSTGGGGPGQQMGSLQEMLDATNCMIFMEDSY